MKTKHLIYISLLLATASTCSKEDRPSVRENPFENPSSASLKIENTSNADSLFLSWSVGEGFEYDRAEIRDELGKNSINLDGKARSCTLTHIPAATATKVFLSLFKGAEKVEETTLYVNIDGLDKHLLAEIIPDKGSVTAGDGMYSIALPGDKSIFLMGDSYIGEVTGTRRSTSDKMYRNTYSVFDHKTRKSYYIIGEGDHSAAVPEGQPFEQKWYWPGHGFVVDNTLYIFQLLMYQGADGMWGFRYENTHLLEYSLPDIKLIKDTRIPYVGADNIHYGAAALADGDGYLYIYAQVDIANDFDPKTEVYVARTTKENIRTTWEYWNGKEWVLGGEQAAGLSGLTTVAISSQFNVFKLDGKYVLLTQKKNWNSGEVYTFISDKPQGPWRNKKMIYKVPSFESKSWFTYNAMAHPQLEKEGMFPVSYCYNTENFSEQFTNVYCYRPRFFWIEKETILN